MKKIFLAFILASAAFSNATSRLFGDTLVEMARMRDLQAGQEIVLKENEKINSRLCVEQKEG